MKINIEDDQLPTTSDQNNKENCEMETINKSENKTIHNETESDISVTPVLNERPSRTIQPPAYLKDYVTN